ncbi:hypothetical protein [Leptospira levettii]|uniref:hypothetical protein n=1 Tax=Leptospira levettii TaxID=2023178 RepID=UPI0013FDDBBC|nr:hypothetical protein [Leptospira levettii]
MKTGTKILLLPISSLALTFILFNLIFGEVKGWDLYVWIFFLFVTMVVIDVLDYWVKRV